jgi:WD40 repeat protein
VDWFSRRIDKLLLSGDGGRLFGVGSNGVIVVWDAQSGHLLLRFRTDLSSRLVAGMSINASPSFQVDWRGERALVWDRDANRALVISLKKDVRDWTVSAPLPTSVIDLASQGAQRSTPDAAGGWGAGRWSTLQMTPDGKRVVGTWAQRKKEGDGGRTDVRVWSVDDREVKAVASGASEDFAAVRGELSSDGALLAALGPKGLYVWALAATEIGKPPRSLPLPVVDTRPPQLMSFDASVPSLFVSAGKSLFSWSSSTEKPTRLPDHEGGVYGARLSTDGQSVLVYSGKLVERCDAATGRLISDFMAARPPDSLFLGLGADKMGVAWWTRDELRVRPFALEAEGDRYLSSTAADWDPVAGSPVIVDQILGEHGGYVVHDTPEVPGGLSLVNLQSAPGEQPAAAVAIRGATQDVVTVLVAGGRVVLTSSSGDVHAGSLKGKPTKIAHISVNDDPSLVVLSADGRWLTTPSRSGISIWDERGVNRRTVQFPLARTASLKKIAIASDGPQQARLVAADSEGHVFSARTGESGTQLLVEELTPKEREEHLVSVLAISPKGVVSVGGIDGTIALWDRSGRPYPASARAIQGSSISDLRFVKGGDLLVSASTEGTDRVWDASDGTLRCTMRDQPEGVSTVQIESEGGARILSVGEKDAIVWSAEDCVTSLHFDGVSHVGFVPGGRDRFLVVSSQFREDRGTLVEARASGDATAGGPRGRITWGAFAGESTLIAGDTVGQLFSWNVKDAANPPVRLGAPMPGDPLIAQAANRIVALMPGGELRTIDSLSKTEAAQLPMDAGWTARSIALTKDGASLFAAESSKGSLRFRRFDGPLFGVASDPVPLPTGTVCAVDERFARDPVVLVATLRGAPLVLAIEKTCLRMWSAEGKLVLEKVMTLQGDPISAALSPTTNHLAIALDSGLAFWELTNPSAWDAHVVKLVASSDLLSSSRRRERTRTIRFHPDGRFMVTTSNSGVALLWEWDEAAGGQGEVYLLAPLEPNAGLSWATFSPDGDELATGGKQGRIKLWDTSTHVDLDKTLAWLKPWLAKAP